MIGVVVRELTYLKILQPIMEEFCRQNIPYILYHLDSPRGQKEYNRATLNNIKLSSTLIVDKAFKIKAFTDDTHLQKQFTHDKTTKIVSLEIYLWAKSYINSLKKNNIKIYSILYLTDSFWTSDSKNIASCDRVYYSSNYLKNSHLQILGLKEDPNRDRWIGMPTYDVLKNINHDSGILVMLPNLKDEHVNMAFGNKENFLKILDNIINGEANITFKTRKKQWMPKELNKYNARIVNDGDIMYPPSILEAFKSSDRVVMFYSSGIYEAVCAGNYVLNIPLSLKRWQWDKQKMNNYFNSSLYNYNGVVQNITQEQALKSDFKIGKLDHTARQEWLKQYMGDMPLNSTKAIVEDIVK